jgi:phosphoribosylanthranilate isomerase
MPTEVKICGLSEEESVDVALDAGADFVGFVFFAPSPRNVSVERATALAERARGKAGIVALTVDADDALLRAISEALRPDLLQLHGRETPERVVEVGAMTGRSVMKALLVATRADLVAAERYAAAHRFLVDAKPPKDATRPGGNAAVFDWSILEGFAPQKPWLLAGGLNPGNVADALRLTGAPGVDVSSGVESVPGRKDPDLIRAFVRVVRDYDRSAHRHGESRPARRLAG